MRNINRNINYNEKNIDLNYISGELNMNNLPYKINNDDSIQYNRLEYDTKSFSDLFVDGGRRYWNTLYEMETQPQNCMILYCSIFHIKFT